MAFVCTAHQRDKNFEVFTEGTAYSVVTPVGYDNAADLNYFVIVGLHSLPTGEMEFYFHLLEINGETKAERVIWNARHVSEFIGSADRRAILDTVLAATKFLLSAASPRVVFRCTWDEYPPDKALEKHYEINNVFVESGYAVKELEERLGKKAWLAERK